MDIIGRELLRENHAGAFSIKGEVNSPAVNYGAIRVENNILVYYTRKAMLEMGERSKTHENVWKELEDKGEMFLIENGYIETISLEDIERIHF